MSFFGEGPFQCSTHNFVTNNAVEAENHYKNLEHYATFGSNGRCSHCNKKHLYFHNVRYIGLPHLWDLICQDCSPKVGKPANAFIDPIKPFQISKEEGRK